jgi:multiple sugar transport system permease protein
MTTESNYTVPVGIVAMQPTNTYQPQIRMMGSIFAALPLFLLLIVLQDKLVNAVQMQAGKA